ncbi:hypothetical protein F3Y22_tig00113279pilonHSYRG00035 [Hibiscus syriacus]|uniref:Phorbol-ester/DAG-type domain-containing protein n=1 Tax=Hibiscus syriacus TaxID=106335 RepID=A0A6A2WQ40_HIBSY|nr:hypothetical protein F3Y22_tig00113279pilonHSYRG00035 [Hibiscus syriacus]
MEFQHFVHHHKLSFVDVEKKDTISCLGCTDIIVGPAYSCRECPYVAMHKSCAELPPQIQKHTFHPHPLRFNLADLFVCDACRRLTVGAIYYSCMHCELKLDFRCAMAVFNDENEVAKRAEEEDRPIHHFCHPHQLKRCLFSPTQPVKGFWEERKWKCVACNQQPQWTTPVYMYVCLPCVFLIHESCMNEMPEHVERSPFHPHHILRPRLFPYENERIQVRCYACRDSIKGFSFYCNECDVNFHASCAKYPTRAIKHTCHPHNLLQLGKSIIHNISCNECGIICKDSSFSCRKCEYDVHPQCILLPTTFKHKRHLHPLTLVSPFVEDDSGDYCCDMCETERNPDLQVYCCEECNFIAHIDCALSEVLEPTIEMLFDPQRKEENSGDQSLKMAGKMHHEMIQRDSFHPHPLMLEESETKFVCDGCEELCIGLFYTCKLCSFNLDHRCATLNDETREVKKTKITITHFSHIHQLTRCKINILHVDPKIMKTCKACRQRLSGVIYACLPCEFFLHESCLKDMLEEVQSSFHPQHPLRTFAFLNDNEPLCDACSENVEGLVFSCFECAFHMHYSCATYQFREVKHGCHVDHCLLYLGKGFFGDESPRCNECGQACENTLWGCLECEFYIHLECISLPFVVKHRRHLHPLVLTTVTEDDSGKYYCDTCETQRNPEHDVYHCK